MANIKIKMDKWTEEDIKGLLMNSDMMVMKSLIELYKCQEDDEKEYAVTTHRNGIGFSGYDAKILTKLAKRVIKDNGFYDSDVHITRIKMLKYKRQLTKIANIKDSECQLEFDFGGLANETGRDTKA